MLHIGVCRSVAWQTFLASFVRWRLILRFGLACISAGTSLLFIGHFPTLKPTGQMFAPMTSTVGKFVCQGYVLRRYPPAADAFIGARAVVCHAELVVLPSSNRAPLCGRGLEVRGVGGARSLPRLNSVRPGRTTAILQLMPLLLLMLLDMVYRRFTTVGGGVALEGIATRPGWMPTPML